MISYREIIDAIEREDMVEAHRLVRERKAQRAKLMADIRRLAPIVLDQPGMHDEKLINRALKLMTEGNVEEARAVLEEQMTPEQIEFGYCMLELMGFGEDRKNVPQSVDTSMARDLINKAFEGVE